MQVTTAQPHTGIWLATLSVSSARKPLQWNGFNSFPRTLQILKHPCNLLCWSRWVVWPHSSHTAETILMSPETGLCTHSVLLYHRERKQGSFHSPECEIVCQIGKPRRENIVLFACTSFFFQLESLVYGNPYKCSVKYFQFYGKRNRKRMKIAQLTNIFQLLSKCFPSLLAVHCCNVLIM